MTTAQVRSTAALKARLAAFFHVEGGEAGSVGSMVGLNFVISLSFVLVQTSAFALFIETFGAHALPYAYFSVAILSSLIAYLYLRLSQRLSFAAGLYVNLAFLAAMCLVFWLGLRSDFARSFIFLLPFWFQTLVNLANLVVWHTAGHMFNVRQAKRLFGLIVAGNWLANILGGIFTASYLALVAPSDLYLLAAIVLLTAAVVLWATILRHQPPTAAQKPVPPRAPAGGTGITAILKQPYSRLIFAYTLLWWISFFILENVFFHEVEHAFASSAALAIFLGRQLAVMGVIALITTSVLTSRVAHRYGLRIGLLAMPVVVVVAVLLLAVGGSLGWSTEFRFWAATLARTLNVALGFSISQAMGSLLFQPLLGNLRSATQTVAEGIMQPLAIGLAGIVLLVFNTTLNFDAVGLSYIFLVLAIPWFWTIFKLARQYPLVMSEALKKRGLGENTTLLFDASAVAQLRASLGHPRPALALYALNQLEQAASQAWPQILIEELPDLLAHASPEVRLESLKRVLSLQPADALPVLRQRLADEIDPQVRSMLLRILAVMGDPLTRREVLLAVASENRVVQCGAILGLLASTDTEGAARAAAALQALVSSEHTADRLSACEVLREVRHPDATGHLIQLIGDRELAVRRAALRAAEQRAGAGLFDAVLAACDDPATARPAERALIALAKSNIELTVHEFHSAKSGGISARRLLSLARVLGRIQHPDSHDILASMMTAPDPLLRLQVLLSLSRLQHRVKSPEQVFDYLRTEVVFAAWLAASIDLLQGMDNADRTRVLADALEISFREAVSRVLLLLSFLYDARAVLRAMSALEQAPAHRSPMALETIDALLPVGAKAWILPLIEDTPHSARLARWRAAGVEIPAESADGILRVLIEPVSGTRHNAWSRMCAIYVAALRNAQSLVTDLESVAAESHPGLASMARWALARLSPARQRSGGSEMLSLVERVLILKSAPLFVDTPDNVLAEIAGLVEEVAFEGDQAIFDKGEPGDSLYIIVSGSVKVWDGDRLLNELRDGEVFGELALLDPEPRLASVKAAESTSLLRLDAPHFREVLDSQPEVSAAIIRVVTRYLRTQLQYAREAGARLRALESFRPLGQEAGN